MCDPLERYFIYILLCADGSYYIGVTNNVEERLAQHEAGDDPTCYTFKRRPAKLVFAESFREVFDAIETEKQIKGWSRKKKEALIRGDFELLHELARRRTPFKKKRSVPCFETTQPCHPACRPKPRRRLEEHRSRSGGASRRMAGWVSSA